MPEKDKKTVVMKSGLSAAAPYVAIGVGGYLLLRAIDKKDFDIPSPGDIAGGVYENLRETIEKTTKTIIKEAGSIGDLPKDRALSPKEEAAIVGREEPGQPWSLKPSSTKQIREAPKSSGAWVENIIDSVAVASPAKTGPTRGVPTGVLSEYTPKTARETVFEDKSYKGPSLFGWLFKTPSTKKTATGVYVPGYGIAQNVSIPKTGWSTTKPSKTPTSGKIKVGGSFGSEEAEAKKAVRISGGKTRKKEGEPAKPTSIKAAKSRKLTIRRA